MKHHTSNLSPHFFKELNQLNENNSVKYTDLLVTIDVSSLYTNIDSTAGPKAVMEVLEEKDAKKFPTYSTISHPYIQRFLQLIGTVKGAVPAFL